jgi:hypothetical protein
MCAHQPGAATPIEVTGQSGQSKLLTAGEHRPGGPTIAEPDGLQLQRAAGLGGPGGGGGAWTRTADCHSYGRP